MTHELQNILIFHSYSTHVETIIFGYREFGLCK